jgi:hypothetical protein
VTVELHDRSVLTFDPDAFDGLSPDDVAEFLDALTGAPETVGTVVFGCSPLDDEPTRPPHGPSSSREGGAS